MLAYCMGLGCVRVCIEARGLAVCMASARLGVVVMYILPTYVRTCAYVCVCV